MLPRSRRNTTVASTSASKSVEKQKGDKLNKLLIEAITGTVVVKDSQIGYIKNDRGKFKLCFDSANSIDISQQQSMVAFFLSLVGSYVTDMGDKGCISQVTNHNTFLVKWETSKKNSEINLDKLLSLFQDPYVGLRITKTYDDGSGTFSGVVESTFISKGERWYNVQFDDGDEDNFTKFEIAKIVKNPPKIPSVNYIDLEDTAAAASKKIVGNHEGNQTEEQDLPRTQEMEVQKRKLNSKSENNGTLSNSKPTSKRRNNEKNNFSKKTKSEQMMTSNTKPMEKTTTTLKKSPMIVNPDSLQCKKPTAMASSIPLNMGFAQARPTMVPYATGTAGMTMQPINLPVYHPPGQIVTINFWSLSLKLALQQFDGTVIVNDFSRGDDNMPGEAEACGHVARGDFIIAINGSKDGVTNIDTLVARLRESPRPVLVSFRKPIRDEALKAATFGINCIIPPLMDENGRTTQLTSKKRRGRPKSVKKGIPSSSPSPMVSISSYNPNLTTASATTMVKCERASLNLALKFIDGKVLIDSFTKDAMGQSGEVQASNRVFVGDIVVGINGTRFPKLKDLAEAVELIKSCPRPMFLVFERLPFSIAQSLENVSKPLKLSNNVTTSIKKKEIQNMIAIPRTVGGRKLKLEKNEQVPSLRKKT